MQVNTKKVIVTTYDTKGYELIQSGLNYKKSFSVCDNTLKGREDILKNAKEIIKTNGFVGNCTVTFGSRESVSVLVMGSVQ